MLLIVFLLTSVFSVLWGLRSFFQGNFKVSLLIFFFLATECFDLIPFYGGSFSYSNVAIVYMMILLFYSRRCRLISFSSNMLERNMTHFFVFMICCCLFSYLYYDFAPFEIFRVVKWWLPFWGVYLYGILYENEYKELFSLLLKWTVFLNVLYIVGSIIHFPILGVYTAHGGLGSFGFMRYYNKPVFSTFFLFYLLFDRSIIECKSKRIFSILIFVVALILSLNRTEIIGVAVGFFVGALFQLSAMGKVKKIVLLALFCIPVAMVMDARSQSDSYGHGQSDISAIYNESYKDYEMETANTPGGTMTFRVAMLYERFDYMMTKCNIFEKLFGLGLGHSDYNKVFEKYHFTIGTRTGLKNGAIVSQLESGDMAWVGMLCMWGMAGLFLFCYMVLRLFCFFFEYRNDVRALTCIAYIPYLVVSSLAGSFPIQAVYWILPFLTYFCLLNKRIESEGYTH